MLSLSSSSSSSTGSSGALMMDRRWKANIEIAPNCPRCASTNTKFCYYNNYSLSQPRYFCKACRRYWTKGGSLRNVPFGGGCRKSRRSTKSSSSSISHHQEQQLPSSTPSFLHQDDDLNCDPVENSMPIGSSSTSNHHIDLADVFSKFLSHGDHQQVHHEHQSHIDHFSNSSCSTTDCNPSYGTALSSPIDDHFKHHQHEYPNEIEMISSSNLVMEEQEGLMVPRIVGGTDHDRQVMNNTEGLMQDLMGNVNAFGGHHEEDVSWSDVNSGSSFDSWQQMQFPDHQMYGNDEADVVVQDDHSLMFLPTLLQSNWTSFDIPSYGA